jgi:hypothetical protein
MEWGQNPRRDSRFCLLKNVQTGSESVGIRVLSWGNQSVKLTVHFCLVPRLGINEAIPLVQPYACMTKTGTTSGIPMGGGLGGSNPPRNSEVSAKPSRIPSSVENTSELFSVPIPSS